MRPQTLFAAALPLAACSSTAPSTPTAGCDPSGCYPKAQPTSSYATNDIEPLMTAESNGSSMSVRVVLQANADQYLYVGDGDALTASLGATPFPLTEHRESSHWVWYTAELPALADAGDVHVSFLRSDSKVSAPATLIHVPAPFDFTMPVPATINAHQGFDLTVEGAGPARVQVSLDGECLQTCLADNPPSFQAPCNSFYAEVDAKGRGRVDLTRLGLQFKDQKPAECDVFVSARIEKAGPSDGAFSAGRCQPPLCADVSAQGTQVRAAPAHLVW
jgi:hypothetical protein